MKLPSIEGLILNSVSVFVLRNLFPRRIVYLNFLLVWIWSILYPFDQFRFEVLALSAQFRNTF